MDPQDVHAKAIELGKVVLRMTTRAGAGHPSSALSLAHIVTSLMYGEMRYDPRNPWHYASDRLVLSEGHAVPIIYAAYADIGGYVGFGPGSARPLETEELDHLRELDSVLDGHPNPAAGFPFFDAATGSLGMGLSVAAGLSLGAQLDGTTKQIYCLLGDGESREGQVGEALDWAIDHSLGNICAVFNCNGEGQAGRISPQQSPEVLEKKLSAFGWRVIAIDGHDPRQIAEAFEAFREDRGPVAVIARTTKGWGVKPLQGGNFHGKPLPPEQLEPACASLDEMRQRLVSGTATRSSARMTLLEAADRETPRETIVLPDFEACLAECGFEAALEKQSLATRRAYGIALRALGTADPRVVALDGDVCNSTFSELFAKRHPDRFFEGKIAEQNLISAAVGLAAAGKIPFVSSFGKFIARGYDQIELAAISRANVKVVGSHAGLGPASDGPSQMSLADVAFFRTYSEIDDGRGQPACVVFQPADAIAAFKMTALMANIPGLCYMRTHRPDVSFVYPYDENFEVGGCKVIREGQDVTVVASGYMVGVAMTACDHLAQAGVAPTLIDAYSLPLQADAVLQAAGRTDHLILTVEDNYGGGFGAAVADAAAGVGGFKVRQLKVDGIPKSAKTPEKLLDLFGLSPQQICEAVQRLLGSHG